MIRLNSVKRHNDWPQHKNKKILGYIFNLITKFKFNPWVEYKRTSKLEFEFQEVEDSSRLVLYTGYIYGDSKLISSFEKAFLENKLMMRISTPEDSSYRTVVKDTDYTKKWSEFVKDAA